VAAQTPLIHLARHGETAWTIAGRHTGLTDLPLTERGERNAVNLGERLKGVEFTRVFTSPLQRAKRTCELAGYGPTAIVDHDLVEWDYGDYEGLRGAEIQQRNPGWLLFRDGCPNGDTLESIRDRADRVITRIRAVDGNVLVFSSAHFLRSLAARWLGLEVSDGRYFLLSTASLSVIGYEHNRLEEPAVRLWNDDRHVGP
jgi:probable phosphoglycerate mutase